MEIFSAGVEYHNANLKLKTVFVSASECVLRNNVLHQPRTPLTFA